MPYSGGNGTQYDPYLIANLQDFKDIELNMTGKYFKQIADISLGNFQPIGYLTTESCNTFTGYYDGDNYSLKDGIIDFPTSYYVGIFGSLAGGRLIKNLQITNVLVVGKYYVGILCGNSNGDISHIVINNNSSVFGTRSVGGIVGRTAHSDAIVVHHCVNHAIVNGNDYVGGIAGEMGIDGTVIEDCYNTGEIVGNDYVGGIVGRIPYAYGLDDDGHVRKCYNSGNITGSSYIGGIVGYGQSSSITNCFALNTKITRAAGSIDTHVGRIVGQGSTSNNYAINTMEFVNL